MGSLMRAHMVPTMRPARFLASPERSRRPRCTTGTMSARLAASTAWMNTVDSSAASAALACLLGSAMAASSAGLSFCTSGLRTTDPTCDEALEQGRGQLLADRRTVCTLVLPARECCWAGAPP